MTKNNNKKSLFWISYGDMMTSLFFVMLILFVIVVVAQGNTQATAEAAQQQLEATQQQLEAIRAIQLSTKDLSKEYFEYRDDYKKYVLRTKVQFPRGQSEITNIDIGTREQLTAAGREIQQFLTNHKENKYLLIIEGQASQDNYVENYQLSYERALALIRYWTINRQIAFGDNCEILIAGSGDGKIDTHSMREQDNVSNQRFLIHIVPKNIFNDDEEE